jgi:hypothetical protein
MKADFRVRHLVGEFVEIDIISVFGLCINIKLERRIAHCLDVKTIVGGSSIYELPYVEATSLAEVPALASTLTRPRDQCRLCQQGVYIQCICTTESVSSRVASCTRFI